MAGLVPVLQLPQKMYYSLFLKISVINPIYFELYGPFFTTWIAISNFAYIATAKSRISAENKVINVSALPPSGTLFTAIVLLVL